MVHSLAPAGLNLPARQPPSQVAFAAVVAPTGPKRPGLHAVPAHEVAPSVSENRPDSHAVHCRAPVVPLYFPRPHALHVVEPICSHASTAGVVRRRW